VGWGTCVTLFQGKREESKEKEKKKGEVEEDRVNSKEILVYTKKSNSKMNLI
jgi:hypothetical protein